MKSANSAIAVLVLLVSSGCHNCWNHHAARLKSVDEGKQEICIVATSKSDIPIRNAAIVVRCAATGKLAATGVTDETGQFSTVLARSVRKISVRVESLQHGPELFEPVAVEERIVLRVDEAISRFAEKVDDGVDAAWSRAKTLPRAVGNSLRELAN